MAKFSWKDEEVITATDEEMTYTAPPYPVTKFSWKDEEFTSTVDEEMIYKTAPPFEALFFLKFAMFMLDVEFDKESTPPPDAASLLEKIESLITTFD